MAADPAAGRLPDSDELAELIEALGAALASEYQAVEAEQIQAVADALRAGKVNDPAVLADLRRLAQAHARALAQSPTAERVVALATLEAARMTARRLGRDGVPGSLDAKGRALVLDLRGDLATMTANIRRWAPEAYRTASSMLTLDDRQAGVVERFLARGITARLYRNGARMPIGSYAEMVTRTIVHQAAIVGATETMLATGVGLCQIIVGNDACETCAANRGKVWSIDGTPAGPARIDTPNGPIFVVVAGSLAGASRGSHFRGPNCRCQIVAYSPGLAQPATTWNRNAEQARDRQRALERNIRKWKAREVAALGDEAARDARRRVRKWQAELRAHLDATGRVRNRYREQLAFAQPVPPGRPVPVWSDALA